MKGQTDADVMKEEMLREPMDHGQLKQDDPKVKYMTADQGPFACGHCTYFIDPNSCQKVSGDIDPEGCCNLYESVDNGEDPNAIGTGAGSV